VLDRYVGCAIVGAMNTTQISQQYIDNRNTAWQHAYNAALARYMDEGHDLATASTMADDKLFQVNWILANPEE